MLKLVATVTADARREVMLTQALQKALDEAPPPPPGNSIQTFTLQTVEIEYGGFVGSTRTRVTLDVSNGPLPESE